MTAAPAGPSGNHLFSAFSNHELGFTRTRGEAFLLSLLAQVLGILLLILFASLAFRPPTAFPRLPADVASKFPIIFRGPSGGGGGDHDTLPAMHGALPTASVIQLAPATVMQPQEMPRLAVQPTVELAPEIKLPDGAQVGDPWSESKFFSNGRGGPGGIGDGCCDGVGPGSGPGAGPGPGGRYIAGHDGVTVPRAIYSPEPMFSDEARKSKTQGNVVLILIVGADGRAHDVRVQSSLGMGLDEKAIDAVKTWRFLPATYKGHPVDSQIAIEVNFHLY
jgi:periplasmic protein TonB